MIHLSDTALAGAAVMRARWLCQLQCCNRSIEKQKKKRHWFWILNELSSNFSWDTLKFHQKIWTSMSPPESPFPILAPGNACTSALLLHSLYPPKNLDVETATVIGGHLWWSLQLELPVRCINKASHQRCNTKILSPATPNHSFSKPIQTKLNHSIRKILREPRNVHITFTNINK